MESKESVRVVVFGLNASGQPDIALETVKATAQDVEFGNHYEMAGLQAEQKGYDVRMTADESDPAWMALKLDWRVLHEDINYAAALAICEALGVNLKKEHLPELGDRWKWDHRGKVCYGTCDSREEAALNAMRYYYQLGDWKFEVAKNDTTRGYLEWAVACAERDSVLADEVVEAG